MEKLKPKLFSVMKSYTKEQFVKDVIAGIIVAIIALPLSIALALASGVTPEKGIYTAITAGFVISFLGGSELFHITFRLLDHQMHIEKHIRVGSDSF